MTHDTIDRTAPPALPERPPRMGPVARRRLVTATATPLLGLLAAGTALVALGGPALQAAGLSLVVPGAGFLLGGHPIAFVVTAVLFAVALVVWWGASAVAAPPAVVLAAVLLSALVAPSDGETWAWAVPATYVVWVAAVVTAVVRFERAYRAKVAAIPELNAYLATAVLPEPSRSPRESSDFDSAMLAHLLALGLQPDDEFTGFDYGEQLHGGTCLRYQLSTLGSALAVAQANLLPNFPSLVSEAQHRFVRKQTDIRTWRYWQAENLLGNFSLDPDPVARDNIMFSGFLASQIGELEAATGSTAFDEPGSLTFTWRDGRTFEYDHHRLVEALATNFRAADLGIFACEPGWVFTVCNAMAGQGMRSYELAHAGTVWSDVEPAWRAGMFGEQMTPDGAIRHLRSSLFGFTFNDGDGTGEYFRSGSHNFEDTAPDISHRGALLQMRGVPEKIAGLAQLIDDDGLLALSLEPKRERGTRYLTTLTEWIGIVAGAQAVGRDDVARAAEASMVRDCAVDQSFPQRPFNGGLMLGAALMSIVWGTPLSTADLARRGYVAPRGPVLESAPWPEILVSRATSADGVDLDLVVEPHRATPGETHRLRLSSPAPGTHVLRGPHGPQRVEPDGSGTYEVDVVVDGRTSLTFGPAAQEASA